MDCSLQGSSVHGILQAGILECVAISFSRGSAQPGNQIWVSSESNPGLLQIKSMPSSSGHESKSKTSSQGIWALPQGATKVMQVLAPQPDTGRYTYEQVHLIQSDSEKGTYGAHT